MYVFSKPDDKYHPVGKSIAEDSGQRLLESFDDIEDKAGHIHYVAEPTNIDERELIALQERMRSDGASEGGFSIITGRSKKEARHLFDADDEFTTDVVASQQPSPEHQQFDSGVKMLEGGAVTASNLAETATHGAHSLVLHSNGWPIHLNLSNGYLCGVPSESDNWEFRGDQPYCVADDEIDCPLDEPVVRSDSLQYDHVFVESCSSAIANSTSGLPVHVVLGLMQGVSSLIGAYRPGPTTYPEVVFYHTLLRAGYNVTEICYLLNRTAEANGVMTHPYIPFGEGTSKSIHAHETDVRYTQSSDTVVIESASGPVIDLNLDLELNAEDRDLRISCSQERNAPLYYAVFSEGDSTRLLIYQGSEFEEDSFEVTVYPSPAGSETLETLNDAVSEARRTCELNLDPDGFETRQENLRSQLRSLGQQTSPHKQDATQYDSARKRVREPLGNLEAMQDELASLAADGDYLYYKYGAVAIDDDASLTSADCHRCGRPVFMKTVSNTRNTARRAIGNCPQCGHIYDVPHRAGDENPEYPIVSGELEQESAASREISITFTNPRNAPMRARFVPSILKMGDKRGEYDFFAPTERVVQLAPGEETTEYFELNSNLLYDNQHFVLGRVVGNGRLYSGRSILFVGESTGHLRPNQR